jgi:hypothetical protein
MEITEEVAVLCLQAADETDGKKLVELTKRINEILAKQQDEAKPSWQASHAA